MVRDDTTSVLVAVAVCNIMHVLFYSILYKVCVTGLDTVTKASNSTILSCSLLLLLCRNSILRRRRRLPLLLYAITVVMMITT